MPQRATGDASTEEIAEDSILPARGCSRSVSVESISERQDAMEWRITQHQQRLDDLRGSYSDLAEGQYLADLFTVLVAIPILNQSIR